MRIRDLAPLPPPYPPVPKFMVKDGSPPELPEFPKPLAEIEDMVMTGFNVSRGLASVARTRRRIDRLLREPTEIFPFGEKG